LRQIGRGVKSSRETDAVSDDGGIGIGFVYRLKYGIGSRGGKRDFAD
jgi:hypothetical protein